MMIEFSGNSAYEKQPRFSERGERTLLDAGRLPIEDLAILALREGRRPRPIYQVHRWFARRFGSAFRALLTAAALPEGADFWPAYYHGTDWGGCTILDPFVGGGTSIIEALRLGATVVGIDVDAVACAVTRFETHLGTLPDIRSTLDELKCQVGERLAQYYQTVIEGNETREVLHYFWVQVVDCPHCGHLFEAHPHYQLAYEAEGTLQWVFCPNCHDVKTISRNEAELCCERCSLRMSIQAGTTHYGLLKCPHCKGQERLIDIATRTNTPPRWRLFALETLEPAKSRVVPMKQRCFRPATAYDESVLENALSALQARKELDGTLPWIARRSIPQEGRVDNRLVDYGYRHYWELFNPRQLLHLSLLAEAIDGLEEPKHEAMAIAFSDHLTTNCMMTHYAFGWRRLAPLFSVRAYRHITRPVEINPWIDGTGRGTFPNAVRQVQRAIEWTRAPKEALLEGGFYVTRKPIAASAEASIVPHASIIHKNSQLLDFLEDETVDLVLTDPPYFDNIAYSELSDFFLPWLQLFGLIPSDAEGAVGFHENLAAKGRSEGSVLKFQHALRNCFTEIARVLKSRGRLVFTYQHRTAVAWYSLATALAGGAMHAIQLFPLLGDSNTGLHKHEGNSTWDAVFVVVKHGQVKKAPVINLSHSVVRAAQDHYIVWARRLSAQTIAEFRDADQRNFYRACLVAGTFGLFPSPDDGGVIKPLQELLEEDPPPV